MNPPAKPTPAIEAGPPESDPDSWCFQLDPPGEAKPLEEHEHDIKSILANVRRHSRIGQPGEAPNMAVAGLDYATRGWSVFPVHGITAGRCCCGNPACGSPGKHPRVGRGLTEASKAPEQIRAWWGRWPTANIAVATGQTSGFFVLDVDPGHGGDESLQALEAEHGRLPHTVRSLTGGGGEHILFEHVPGLRNSAGRIAPGIDVRGDGGYVVAPPSMHISGRRYAWNVDHHPLDVPIAQAPSWLIGLTQQPGTNSGETTSPARSERWIQAISQNCCESRRNDTLARLAGHLLRRYVDPYVVLELARLWNRGRCQPPLDDAEVMRTVNSICLREAQRQEAS
jgi:hypothetical protein